mmetsp:Transcript_22595/g.22795  ORF Transcript_22595/g.22795 Transcript_22595/m.22795 type:complete len:96 (-) Transcript_22595:75-362(-)
MDSLMLCHLTVCYSPTILALSALFHTEPSDLSLSLQAYMTIRFDDTVPVIMREINSIITDLPEVLREIDNEKVKGRLKEYMQKGSWGKRARTDAS